MSAKKETKKSAKRTTASGKANQGLSAEEIAAMKETLKERKAAVSKEEAENAVLEKIAEMKGSDRTMAKRIHAIIKESAPALSAKTWYGMPAYANRTARSSASSRLRKVQREICNVRLQRRWRNLTTAICGRPPSR